MIAAIQYRREVWLILESEKPARELCTDAGVDLPPGEYLVTGRYEIDGRECYELEDEYVIEAFANARLVVRSVPTPLDPQHECFWKKRQHICR